MLENRFRSFFSVHCQNEVSLLALGFIGESQAAKIAKLSALCFYSHLDMQSVSSSGHSPDFQSYPGQMPHPI